MSLKKHTHAFVDLTLSILYPVRFGLRDHSDNSLVKLEQALLQVLDNNIEQSEIKNERVAKAFVGNMPVLKAALDKDIEAIFEGDPAAKTEVEIILAYPGFQAVACYRIGSYLLKKEVQLLPRLIASYAQGDTGIDIHPGADIGSYLCIDHGTGIVIGETTVIGNHVKIYQGVTLGALSIPNRDVLGKRHPTIEDNVVIYGQAIILGGETVIGKNSVIGGNVWVTESVPPNTKVYYRQNQLKEDKLNNKLKISS